MSCELASFLKQSQKHSKQNQYCYKHPSRVYHHREQELLKLEK